MPDKSVRVIWKTKTVKRRVAEARKKESVRRERKSDVHFAKKKKKKKRGARMQTIGSHEVWVHHGLELPDQLSDRSEGQWRSDEHIRFKEGGGQKVLQDIARTGEVVFFYDPDEQGPVGRGTVERLRPILKRDTPNLKSKAPNIVDYPSHDETIAAKRWRDKGYPSMVTSCNKVGVTYLETKVGEKSVVVAALELFIFTGDVLQRRISIEQRNESSELEPPDFKPSEPKPKEVSRDGEEVRAVGDTRDKIDDLDHVSALVQAIKRLSLEEQGEVIARAIAAVKRYYAAMEVVGVEDFRNSTELLMRVRAGGKAKITNNGKPFATLRPPPANVDGIERLQSSTVHLKTDWQEAMMQGREKPYLVTSYRKGMALMEAIPLGIRAILNP